ncbi:MAG: anti-sigma factor [Rhodospirillales bacterium]|nr:anti-sigma factor [Rhodospirillales bacterium]
MTPHPACARSDLELGRLADGEVGVVRRFLLSRHLRHCAACAARYEEILTMRRTLRERLPAHRAPPALAARIGAALAAENRPAPVPSHPRRPAAFGARLGGVLAGGGVGVLAGIGLTLLVMGGSARGDRLTEDVLASHLRSMMGDHLTDVPTSDRHTVKPWLSARLDVSPPVHDFAAEGFPLVGGRLDYLDGHPAAAVVYRSDRHVINLFVWHDPQGGEAPPAVRLRQGFTVICWRKAGMGACAVSDVERATLERFVSLVAAAG